MEEAAEEQQKQQLINQSKAGCSSKARCSSKAAYIDGLPDEVVLSVIAPKLIAVWDLRLLMLKQVNRAWRSLLSSCRGLFGPFRVEFHMDALNFGFDGFSCREAYDGGCKKWRKVECPSIASRIAVQEDGLKVYAIGAKGICVLNLTGSDEQGRPKSILGNGTLAWKTLMPCGHKHWPTQIAENPDASRSVAIIQGRFVYADRSKPLAKRFCCFHVFDIGQGKWDKIMVSKPDCLSNFTCCRLKHLQRGCVLVLDFEGKELLVYDVISLEERKCSFSIHVEGGKKIDVNNIWEIGDGTRVFAQGKFEDKHLLAFASLDVLLDEGKLKFDEFVEQVNVPEGTLSDLRNDHVGGCHAILQRDITQYLWRGKYVDTNKKQLVWEEEGVELTNKPYHFSSRLL